jgi:prolyl-tRNA editing enzyme YbaK/EbsC (Cys-tRNA(Pro) deacylase)
MPVYAEKTILDLPTIYINGGKRGFLVALHPDVLVRLLGVKQVEVGIRD